MRCAAKINVGAADGIQRFTDAHIRQQLNRLGLTTIGLRSGLPDRQRIRQTNRIGHAISQQHRLLRQICDPCTPLLRRKSRSGMSLQHKVAVRPRIESGKRRQQTAFARTGRADQIHYLTWCDRQRDILENRASLAFYHNLTTHSMPKTYVA